jgi:spore coat protein U-like protein
MYQNSAHTLIWGSLNTPATPNALQISIQIPPTFFGPNKVVTGSATLYGAVPGNQTSVSAGTYTNMFSGSDASFSFDYNQTLLGNGNPPAGCSGHSGGNFAFTAQATVQKHCTITATDMDFGAPPGFLSSNVDTTSALQVQCTNTTAWKIGLDNGQHANGTTRRMQGPGGYVSYELYQDAGRTTRWGNSPGADTVNGSGTGNAQNLTVYGRVPPQTTPSAGNYSDIITVTVTY